MKINSNRKLMKRTAFFLGAILLLVSFGFCAEDTPIDDFVMDTSQADAEKDDGSDLFFAIPSPSEILHACEKAEVGFRTSKEELKVLQIDLGELGEKDPVEAAFRMGSVFAVGGINFQKLNNKVILDLAEKIYKGMGALKLPEEINIEMTRQYSRMLSNPSLNRDEIMISFTSARSSLMYLLKDSGKINDKDRHYAVQLAVALESGLWYQTLSMALNAKDNEDKKIDMAHIFFTEDILSYFDQRLNMVTKNKDAHILLLQLKNITTLGKKCVGKKGLDAEGLEKLTQALAEVFK